MDNHIARVAQFLGVAESDGEKPVHLIQLVVCVPNLFQQFKECGSEFTGGYQSWQIRRDWSVLVLAADAAGAFNNSRATRMSPRILHQKLQLVVMQPQLAGRKLEGRRLRLKGEDVFRLLPIAFCSTKNRNPKKLMVTGWWFQPL